MHNILETILPGVPETEVPSNSETLLPGTIETELFSYLETLFFCLASETSQLPVAGPPTGNQLSVFQSAVRPTPVPAAEQQQFLSLLSYSELLTLLGYI